MNDSTERNGQDVAPTVTEPVPDLQLQMLIRLLDKDPRSSLPITLNVPGGVVYGDLIAHEAWKADWATSLRRVETLSAGLLAGFPETVDQAVGELRGEDTGHHLPRWIHLRKATLTTGGVGPAVELPVWRGRLSDVAGWALGRPD
ncbi:hypothetical protein [Streptomyces sp. NPDC088725]|uniref:hypothetical protein n=1 Tax=Streptomyces sp. NPDC088725 TaxID=3365873 RepID=UPI003809C7EF